MNSSVDNPTDIPKNQKFISLTAALMSSSSSEPTNVTLEKAISISAAEVWQLYIGNLEYKAIERELQAFFKGYLIESFSIPKSPQTDQSAE